jgi:hypothetical protein
MDERHEGDRHRRPSGPLERDRSFDDGAAGEPQASAPRTIQLGRAGRPPGVLALTIVLFVAIAIIKPWPQGVRPVVPIEPPRVVGALATPPPTADPLAELRSHCEQPLGWRVYSIERWADQTLRIWRSLEPALTATDPTDPRIPAIPLGPAVELVGYCSPWDGAERPPAGSTLVAWLVESGAATARGTPIELDLIAPRPASVLGGLFGSPASRSSAEPGPRAGSPATTSDRSPNAGGPLGPGSSTGTPGVVSIWPLGHFVFELAAPGWQRWWAIDIPAPTVAQPG